MLALNIPVEFQKKKHSSLSDNIAPVYSEAEHENDFRRSGSINAVLLTRRTQDYCYVVRIKLLYLF